jgi:hypothetical protein
MLLHPLKDPVALAQEARGPAILSILDDGPQAEAIETFCRALAGLLHTVRPGFARARKDQVAFNALCGEVERWVRAEVRPLRFRDRQGMLVG